MKLGPYIARDKYGYHLEYVVGHRIQNFIRLILHTNIRMTWKRRHDTKPILHDDVSCIKYDGGNNSSISV